MWMYVWMRMYVWTWMYVWMWIYVWMWMYVRDRTWRRDEAAERARRGRDERGMRGSRRRGEVVALLARPLPARPPSRTPRDPLTLIPPTHPTPERTRCTRAPHNRPRRRAVCNRRFTRQPLLAGYYTLWCIF